MIRILLATLICLFTAVSATEAKSLVITLQNSKKVYYILGGETNPMMRFTDGTITMEADEYIISDIKNFYISETDDPSNIEKILTTKHIEYRANTIAIKASDINTIKVYDISGKQINAEVLKNNDIITVNLNSLGSGTYIINADGNSFKVMKK